MNQKKENTLKLPYLTIWIGILSFAFSPAIYGQVGLNLDEVRDYGGTLDPEERALSRTGLSGLGLTFIDGDPFLRFQLQPEVDLGKVGVGLAVVLLYNPSAEEGEDTILAEDGETWDDISTILRVLRYVRYGALSEPFYARLGALDYVTIGHGFIMSGYSNYDRRGLRLNLRTKTKKVGIETVLNDLAAPTVFGGRVFIRPFQKSEENLPIPNDESPADTVASTPKKDGTPILNRLELGATYLTDIEPRFLPDEAEKPETINEEPLIALGTDVGFSLIDNKLLRVDLYDDVAFLNIKRNAAQPDEIAIAIGNAVGLGFSIPKATFKVEYRTFGEGFQPTLFDYTYHSVKGDGLDFWGMDEDDDEGQARKGYFSMVAWRLISKVNFLATFEDYTTTEPRLYAGITESGLVERLSFRAFYVKRDIGEPDPGFPVKAGSEDPEFFEDLFRLDSKSAFSVRIGYEILPRLEFTIIREYRFRQVEDVAGENRFEPIQKTSVEVGFRRSF